MSKGADRGYILVLAVLATALIPGVHPSVHAQNPGHLQKRTIKDMGITFPPSTSIGRGAQSTTSTQTGFGEGKKWHDFFSIGQEFPAVGDVNGDGKADIITFVRDTQKGNGRGDVYVALSDGSRFGESKKWHDWFSIGYEFPAAGDFNGDGKADIITFVRDTQKGNGRGDVYVALSDGSRFGKGEKWHENFCIGQEFPAVGDVNGDGKADIITFVRDTQKGNGRGDVYVALSDGSRFGESKKWHDWFSIGQEIPAVGDVNGDGKADIITFVRDTQKGSGRGDVYVALSDGSRFGEGKKWHEDFSFGQEIPVVGDVNGDGKADIITFVRDTPKGSGRGDVYVALSDGSRFGEGKKWHEDFSIGQEIPAVGDVNGDGKADIITFVRDTKQGEGRGDVYVSLSGAAPAEGPPPLIATKLTIPVLFNLKEKPPPLRDLEPVDLALDRADIPFETVNEQSIWRDTKQPNNYYYLPAAFKLALDRGGNYQMSAVWTNERKIDLRLSLKAEVEQEEIAFIREQVKKNNKNAQLTILPYEKAEIVDLEGRSDWNTGDIHLSSFESLEGNLPIAITMSPESFANLKTQLENQGLAAGFKITSGKEEKEVDINISLRHPAGRVFPPVSEVKFGYDPESRELLLFHVRNRFGFPITVKSIDVSFRFPGWANHENYGGLQVSPPAVIRPGESGNLKAKIIPGKGLAKKMDQLGLSRGRYSGVDRAIDNLLESYKGGEVPENVKTLLKEKELEKISPDLTGAALRYRLGYTIPDKCQPCLDDIWDRVEVATYIERIKRLNIKALESAFAGSYPDGKTVEAIVVDVKSRYFTLSPRPSETETTETVSLNSETKEDSSKLIVAPSGAENIRFKYRLTCRLKDGPSAKSEWIDAEDTLQIIVGNTDLEPLFRSGEK